MLSKGGRPFFVGWDIYIFAETFDTMHNPLQVLKHYWGYDGFRPGQAEVIDSILSGHDTLALMPTGGGRSITFQVPALANPGICLVVSPLVALMKDQVKNLQKRGILSAFISSEMPHWEILQQLDNCILGDYKFLLYFSRTYCLRTVSGEVENLCPAK